MSLMCHAPPEPEKEAPPIRWSLTKRVALRFATLYFLLYFLPMPFSALLDAMKMEAASAFTSKVFQGIWLPIANFAARTAWHFQEPIVYRETGSGDRLFDYMVVFSSLVIAAIGTVVWSLIDRKRNHYRSTYEFLRVVLRYSLAIILMSYGFSKAMQFPPLQPAQLTTEFGQETPMGMLWNFMGSSLGYSLFSGVLEITAGFLMLFRRTTTLAALLGAAVMLNVFALNVFYDVPVKLASFHYFVCCVILLLPDLQRLTNVLLLNRVAEPRELFPPVRFPRLRIAVLVAKWIFVCLLVGGNTLDAAESIKVRLAPQDRMVGVWRVISFKQNGAEVETVSVAQPNRWQKMTISKYFQNGLMTIDVFGGSGQYVSYTDDGKDTLTYTSFRRPPIVRTWKYHFSDQDHLTLVGKLKAGPTIVEFERLDGTYSLVNHKEHWIQEMPRMP